MVMTKQVLHKFILAFLALTVFAAPAYAGWRDQISSNDVDRLAHLDEARDYAIGQAQSRSGQGDFRAVKEILEPQPHAVPGQALYGNWRCRQVKLGGMTGYAVFSWFNCNIRQVNGGLWFQKEGTQRMAGYLYPDNGVWVYLGAQSAKGEPWHRYSGQAASMGAPASQDDQVGVLVGIGPNRLRIDMPSPAVESDFDAIELVR